MQQQSLPNKSEYQDDTKVLPPPSAADADVPEDVRQVEGTLRLLTGETVRVRAIRPDDAGRLQAFHTHLSADSIVFRFFRYLPVLPRADAERFTHLDYRDRMALIAVAPAVPFAPPPVSGGADEAAQTERDRVGADEGAILGVVRYERMGPAQAEVAFVVEDHWQGHGIATALLHRLAAYARARGITQFLAITMATNNRMLEVLRHAGYPLTIHVRNGETEVALDISQPAVGEPVADTSTQGTAGAP